MKIIYSVFIGIALLASCSGTSESNTDASTESAPVLQASASDAKMLDSYLKIKNALVKSSPEDVEEISSGMVAMIGGIGNNEELVSIQEKAKAIAEKQELEDQREAFVELTDEVYEYCKKNPCGKKLYKQYCPMAFDNTGAAWLSDKEEIRNPYFGKMMLKCGKVEEEL